MAPKAGLKHRDRLLADIAQALRHGLLCESRVVTIRVRFFGQDGEMLKEYLGLHVALDHLANDVFWDEGGNWSEAYSAEVDTY